MHYRWNFPEQNLPFIYEEFGKLMFPRLPVFLQRKVGEKLGSRFRGVVPRLGITEETIPALESWYEGLLEELNEHFLHHDFLLGQHPTIADFGFIGPFYAHLYRDPAPGKLMRESAPRVAAWVERIVIPYSLWIFQRPLNFWRSLEGEERVRATNLLEDIGAGDLFDIKQQIRLKRENNKLYLDPGRELSGIKCRPRKLSAWDWLPFLPSPLAQRPPSQRLAMRAPTFC